MFENKMCVGRALRIAVGITALAILLLAGGAKAATPISSCITISSPGEYVLNTSIINSGAPSCIDITSSNVVFDGNGYTIEGISEQNTYGIYVYNSSKTIMNVTVKNLTAKDWFSGINYVNAANGSVANIIATSNNYNGIYTYSSSHIILSNSSASNNLIGIYMSHSSNNTLSGNNASNNMNGIYLEASSHNNTLSGNNASNNSNQGIWIIGGNNNILRSNTVNFNNLGIDLEYSSDNNTLNENNAGFNTIGILIEKSSISNTLIGNNVSNNLNGIFLTNNNILTSNIVSNNNNRGISLGSGNLIYNNYFNNSNNSDIVDGTGSNTWNITKTAGTNIVDGPYLGGNFWANPNGTGFSQTCKDSNSDGICDSLYVLDVNNIDYFPLANKPAITPIPLLVFAITPNSRNAQVSTPVTIFMSVINGGTATANGVSIAQASSLPITVSYQQWNGTAFTGSANTPVDIAVGVTANFVLTINATAAFNSSSLTFNVSGTNAAQAPISGVNTLTISASTVPIADVIMMSTSLAVSTAVNTPAVFAVATANVGGANATGVSLVLSVPTSITGLVTQVNQTNPTTGAIIGPAIGLTINVGDQLTFAVFVTPTAAIVNDPAKNRITLQLVDGSGKIIGAQSVAVSTT
ncbi:MAG: NosD domain-containing protein [Candidatus Methanoperedens sp.]